MKEKPLVVVPYQDANLPKMGTGWGHARHLLLGRDDGRVLYTATKYDLSTSPIATALLENTAD
eukprot:3484886-Prorocentrum_lima.AAC.1